MKLIGSRWVPALCVALSINVLSHDALADALGAETGLQALKEARYSDAYQILGPLAHQGRATPTVRFWAAEAAAHLGLWRQALAALDGLTAELVAVADEIYARQARCHTALGEFEQALAAWHETLSHNPPTDLAQEARFALGPLWLARANPVAAVVAYKNAIAAAPRDPRADDARLRVAGLQQAQGNIKDAQAELMHLVASARDPVAQEAAAALQDLAVMHPEAAQEPPRGAGRDGDESPPSWQTLSHVRDAQRLLGQRRSDDAVLALQKLLKKTRKAERSAVALALGNMLAQLGRTQDAVEVFDSLASWSPQGQKRQEALYRAAYLSYDGKRYAAAKKRFVHFMSMYPRAKTADEALWFVSWCAFHLGQYEDALVSLSKLRRVYPNSSMVPRAEYWSARILGLRQRHAEAARLSAGLATKPGYYGMLARLEGAAAHPPMAKAVAQGAAAAPALGGDAVKQGHELVLGQQVPDEEVLAFVLAQGTLVLDWSSHQGVRVSTLITLGLKEQAAKWVGAVRGLPGVPSRAQALGRGKILYALGDYRLAMRQVTPILPAVIKDDPMPDEEMALRLAYPPAFPVEVMHAATDFDVSELLLLALMRQESAFNTQASSQVSARGLMQIMPQTGRRIADRLGLKGYTDAQLLLPEHNIYLAGWYVGALLQRFNGNLPVAIGSYNAGPTASNRWITDAPECKTDVFVEDIPYRETRDYIKKVLANLEMYSRIYHAPVTPWPLEVSASKAGGVDF